MTDSTNKTELQWFGNFTGKDPESILIGPKGLKGDTGDESTITIGSLNSGEPGTNLIINNVGTPNKAIWDITIPRGYTGLKGDKGDKGNVGSKGDIGNSGTLSINSVTTGLPGSDVIISNIGSSTEAILDITIPRGFQGIQGIKGDKGDTGDAGTNQIGQVISGTTSSFTNIGTSKNAIWNVVLEKGDKGDKGDLGNKGDKGTQWFTGNTFPSTASLGDLWLRSSDGQVLEVQDIPSGLGFVNTPTNLTGPAGGLGLALTRDPLHGILNHTSNVLTVGNMQGIATFGMIVVTVAKNISKANIYVQVGSEGVSTRLSLYNVSSDGGPGTLLQDCGETDVSSSGIKTFSFPSVNLETGFYYYVLQNSAAGPTHRGGSVGVADVYVQSGYASSIVGNAARGRIIALPYNTPFPSDMTDYTIGTGVNQIQYVMRWFNPNLLLRT